MADPKPAALKISPALSRVLDTVFAADLPVLLSGAHGIGKSQFLEGYAEANGLTACVLDLSLLEPTDLTGLPFRAEGPAGPVTRFAPPATLPQPGGRPTLLVLEELNRCDRTVRQPCLQLLTTRRLNDYQLPAGCRLAACINPHDGAYDVDALDPALASRFVTLHVEPDRGAWVEWALARGLNRGIVQFVQKFAQAFERVPPRTWTQAARLLDAAADRGWQPAEAEALLAPVLGVLTAKALMLELPSLTPPVAPGRLLSHPREFQGQLAAWAREARLDRIRHVLTEAGRHLDAIPGAMVDRAGLAEVLRPVPPDLAGPLRARLGLPG